MKRRSARPLRALAACVAALFVVSCSDDGGNSPTGPELVTISGIVRNIDTGEFAVGVRVNLLDTEYKDEVATGTDGAYSLQIPKGSILYLNTEDLDASKADQWFPMINVDLPPVVANGDMLDWPIHACPQPTLTPTGSVATWDEYLRDYDDDNGDLYSVSKAADSKGVFVILSADFISSDNTWPSFADLTVSSGSPDFRISYVNCGRLGADQFIHPATRTTMDGCGFAISWGEPSFGGSSVDLTFTDTNTSRGYNFVPLSCPVRPGTSTLVWVAAIDGVPNRTFREGACAIELFPCQ